MLKLTNKLFFLNHFRIQLLNPEKVVSGFGAISKNLYEKVELSITVDSLHDPMDGLYDGCCPFVMVTMVSLMAIAFKFSTDIKWGTHILN